MGVRDGSSITRKFNPQSPAFSLFRRAFHYHDITRTSFFKSMSHLPAAIQLISLHPPPSPVNDKCQPTNQPQTSAMTQPRLNTSMDSKSPSPGVSTCRSAVAMEPGPPPRVDRLPSSRPPPCFGCCCCCWRDDIACVSKPIGELLESLAGVDASMSNPGDGPISLASCPAINK